MLHCNSPINYASEARESTQNVKIKHSFKKEQLWGVWGTCLGGGGRTRV